MSTEIVSTPAGPADDRPSASLWSRVVRLQAFQILLVLVVIIAVFATLAPISFANIGNARLIAQNASILAVLGVGMTFVIVTSGIDLSIGSMSGGQRQAVAIARAVHWASRVVFLDEPTAALGVRQTANVLRTIRRVADQGIAVVFISHSMPHVIEVSDRVQVLRLGRRVATYRTADTTMEELVAAMTGATGKAAA